MPVDPPADRPASWLQKVPNILTGLRLLLVPVLWVLALLGHATLVGAGTLLAWFTDMLDGPIARRTRSTTRWGSTFDSVADHALTISVVFWLILLRPHFVREQFPLLLGWSILALSTVAVGMIRFGKPGDLHLYSGKLAGGLGYLFGASLLLFGSYSRGVFYAVLTIASLAAIEAMAIFLTASRVDEHRRSILFPPRRAG
ncbi:MAG TPA: CDP-alcohol phosphatidyltransferase family protein [Longimicrobium sp.]|nr:CDP-alcohol phosphatidyltransferase family protein [Longimicrobium sp.]